MLDSLHRKFLFYILLFGLISSIGINSIFYILMRDKVIVQIKDNLEVFYIFKSLYINLIIFNSIIIITGYFIYKRFSRAIIEREKQLREERGTLEYQASYDEFTGVYNRRYGLEVLENSMKISRERDIPLIIIYMDIDDLKHVNDSFGHLEGDRLIKGVVEKVKKNIRNSDFIIRMGGDEFIVGLFSCNNINVEVFLERVNREINREIDGIEHMEKVSFSYGIVKYDENKHKGIEDLVQDADTIMYKNKRKK